ncbi:hypothetical protein EDB19DRAFT_555540 [Suillus lakei]|nr:hypothetical protein EDB19DRAFT_555540 [Suillus lakei]
MIMDAVLYLNIFCANMRTAPVGCDGLPRWPSSSLLHLEISPDTCFICSLELNQWTKIGLLGRSAGGGNKVGQSLIWQREGTRGQPLASQSNPFSLPLSRAESRRRPLGVVRKLFGKVTNRFAPSTRQSHSPEPTVASPSKQEPPRPQISQACAALSMLCAR